MFESIFFFKLEWIQLFILFLSKYLNWLIKFYTSTTERLRSRFILIVRKLQIR